MNGLYNYATGFLSGILWTSPSQNTEENKEAFPLLKLATRLPEVFGNVVSNCQPKDVRNLKITCKEMKSNLQSDKCQNFVAAIFFPKILEDVHLNNLRVLIKADGDSDFDLEKIENILEILSKNSPKLALEIISHFNSIFLSLVCERGINKKLPIVEILKNLHGLLKTTEAKKTLISTLENIFFNYNYDTLYITDELIDLLSEDTDYILDSKNPDVVEFFNKWSIKNKLSLLIQLGDKADSNELARRFYLQAAEIINSLDLNSLNGSWFLNPLKQLALAAQIAKRIQKFDSDKANIILEKINEVYQKIEQHIEFRHIWDGYDKLVEVLPDMKDVLLQKTKTLFSQADFRNKFSYAKDFIMSETLLKELYDYIPTDYFFKYVGNLQAFLKIAEVAFSLEDNFTAEKLVARALFLQDSGCSPEFIKKLIELNKVDEAITLAQLYKRTDLLMLIASEIFASNPDKANSLIDETLKSLREKEAKEKNQSFFSKIVYVQDPTFSRRDILSDYYAIIKTVAIFDPDRARSIAIEALKFREKYKNIGLLKIPCQALKCLFQDPLQAHFLLNNYTFSENEKTFFALATLDQCKNSSIKTTFVSKLDRLNSSSDKEEE